MSQASVHEQAYHLLLTTSLTYQQIADELKSSAHVVVCKRDSMTKVPKGMHVHHINGDKLCNKVWNLALLKSGQHRHIHAILKKVQRLSAYEDIGQRPAWVDLLFKYCLLMMI